MAKINAWVLYRRHFCQNGKAHKDQKAFLQFSFELSYGLILATKVNPSSLRGWPPKRRSLEAPTTSKKPTKALPVTDASLTLAKPYYQQKLMQIIQYDLQNTMFQMQDLSLFTG